MLRLLFSTISLCFCIFLCLGQDSTTQRKPVQQNPKPTQQLNKYQANSRNNSAKADSGSKHSAFSQTTGQQADTSDTGPVDKSLNGQYQYLLTKVYHYQQPFVAALWKSVSDTLKKSRLNLSDAENKIAAQNKDIQDLRTDSVASAQNLIAKKENIDTFGINMSLTLYNVIVWGLIIGLGIAIFGVISQSSGNRTEAEYRIKLYKELEEEFKAYKTKANDKEKKLARELQTERNKLDELLGRG